MYKKKAIALYENKMRVGFIIMTLVMYFFAAILWYMIAAIAPYMATVKVDPSEEQRLTRSSLSASQSEIDRPDDQKERVLLMPSSESSYHRRLRLIADAKDTIDFMVYDSYYEGYTVYLYTALLCAADRGVNVRVIVDGKMGVLDKELTQIGKLLQNHNNIKFYYYKPVDLLDPAGLLVMMHDKVMLVDGKNAIVGGVNLGRTSFTANFDMEVMITNSDENGVAGQIRQYFDDMTTSTSARRIVSKTADFGLKTQCVDEYLQFYGETEFADADIDYKTQGIPVNKITHLSNGSEGNKKAPIIFKALCNLSESSRKTTIVTPYVLLQNDKKSLLKQLVADSDELKIITNSLYNTRNVAYADYYYSRKAYVNANIDLFEYQADNQLHAKIYTFDDKFSVIGSFNLDERSCHIDTESVVVIDSEEFTALVNEYINNTFVNNSLKVSENNKYIPSDTVKEREVPVGKRVKYWFYRALAVVRCLI